ncbi:MAG: redoxin domain-containing protein [Candidatus Diapherotrites archaeon]|uniref:Redoxin domain-containing protein n=1 Tax=Candidatus Iainarchaeum sp. TaxID=3101447 RepID=A0A8T3YLU1_9ARCH|nr:redoxin domain-containing protein [Candidatus Diapherotrites archaeon]
MGAEGILGKILPFAGIILIAGLIGWGLLGANNNNGAEFNEGDMAPDFTLPMVGGGQFMLSELRGKKNVLLYFQEGIMCPACWYQQVDIEKRQAEFDALDTQVVMITVDSPGALAQAKAQYGIRNTLLYDNSLTASAKYDVLQDSMHPGERPGHVFVLIDKSGTIMWRFSAYQPPKNGDHHSGGTGTMYVPVDNILSSVKTGLMGTGAGQ